MKNVYTTLKLGHSHSGNLQKRLRYIYSSLFVFLTFVVFCSPVAAQTRHANFWNFGSNCRVEFQQDGSINASLDPSISTSEGSGSFSHPTSGELLLYTDGTRVYQEDGTIVVADLPGNSSSIHSGIIVPRPLNPSRVYAFGHGAASSTSVGYREFDLSDPTNVVAVGTNNSVATPNGREGMAITQHANGIDYWVLVQGENELYVIPITSSGLGMPVTYPTGISILGFSIFALSHSGETLVTSNRDAGGVFSFDFDTTTGVLSNKITLFMQTDIQNYGGAFSSDDTKFYYSNLGSSRSNLYQYDFTNSTRTLIDTQVPRYVHSQAQLGANGKIYISTGNGSSVVALSVITNPNEPAVNLNYSFASVPMAPGCQPQLGLTQTLSPLLSIAYGLEIVGPTSTILSSSTIPNGTANLVDGEVVTVTVTDGAGFSETCTATVAAGGWACNSPINGLVEGTNYSVDAVSGVINGSSTFDVVFCGGGVIGIGEVCDDGNDAAGDGCSDTCTIEIGYLCPTPGVLCNDIDECADGTDNCDALSLCANTPGSFTCGNCPMGYNDINGDGTLCTDIDECDDGTDNCDALSMCTNTIGAFTCGNCPMGYTDTNGDGSLCTDLDECADGTDNCDALSMCTNTIGAFTCGDCPVGYNDINGVCVNVDECGTDADNCDDGATCTDTPGSFTCTCPDGHADTNGDGSLCTDIDECTDGTDNCDALSMCTNIIGAFTCGDCPVGYNDINGDGSLCSDIDECVDGTDNCGANGTCTNLVGSFSCECDADFTGDGITCVPPVDDTDGDSIPDLVECGGPVVDCPDTDGDGLPDYQDPDDDNDGIPTLQELEEDAEADNDADGDSFSSHLDIDADGDGILDSVECANTPDCEDSDSDGTPDYLDLDSDNDGIEDANEGFDADGDGVADVTPTTDSDSDNDGLNDAYDTDSGGTGATLPDLDGDGTPNFRDNDDDGDSLPTTDEDLDNDGNARNDDTDGDGKPNYLDVDDDNDGINSIDEDTNGNNDLTDDDDDNNGIPNYLQASDDFIIQGGCSTSDSQPFGYLMLFGVFAVVRRRRTKGDNQ